MNYTDDGRKKGECSLFSSLEFTSQDPKSIEHQTQNAIALIDNDAKSENNEKFDYSANVKVS